MTTEDTIKELRKELKRERTMKTKYKKIVSANMYGLIQMIESGRNKDILLKYIEEVTLNGLDIGSLAEFINRTKRTLHQTVV